MSDEERQEKYSKQMVSYHRKKILERVRNALRDFAILYEHLPDDQREQIFSPAPNSNGSEEQQAGERVWEKGRLNVWCMCFIALLYEQQEKDEFEDILEKAITHVLADERRPDWVDPASEGIGVELSITHTDTVMPNRMAQKIRQSGVDRLSPSEQRALLHLLQVTGEKAPETPDEFAEVYRSFITDHYEGDPVDMDRAIITLDPFGVTEGPPNPLNDDDVMPELTGEFP